jgi:hypothetical protein
MKLKNTLILLIIALAALVLVPLFESKHPSTQEAAEQAGRMVKFDRDKITAITIKNTDNKIELRKQDGAWYLEAPLKDHADSMAVNQLFTSAEALKSIEAIPIDKQSGKDLMKEFGLASADTRVTFIGDDKPVEILIGKEAAVEGKVYARLEDSKTAQVISNDLQTQLTKKVDEFRDHKLTDLLATQVTKFALQAGKGEIELDKRDEHWSLEKPFKARGSDARVADLISKAANAQVDSFVADSSNLSSFGLQDPRGTVAFTTDKSKEPVVLQIGQPLEKDKEKIYVKVSTRAAVLVVPKSVAAVLDTKPNDVRDHKLIRVSPDIVDRINIESPGKEKIVLARKGESWVRKADGKDVAINAAGAARLLSELDNQQVIDFVADVATDLPQYGLDQPQETITFSSYASENTAETKAGEKPIVSILFGKTDGDKVYAKLDDEPFVVSVPTALLASAMTDPLQWQDLSIVQVKPEDISGLEVAREGQPTITLERDKDKNWVLAKGDGKVDQTHAQSLVNTLASLHAVRWIGATTPEHGLAQPKVTITYKAASGGGKLLLGGQSADLLTYASAEGLTGTFGLSQPDVSALELSLIQGAPAAPTATPAAATPAPKPATEERPPASPPVPAPSIPSAIPAAPPATPSPAPAAPPAPGAAAPAPEEPSAVKPPNPAPATPPPVAPALPPKAPSE